MPTLRSLVPRICDTLLSHTMDITVTLQHVLATTLGPLALSSNLANVGIKHGGAALAGLTLLRRLG